METLLVIIAIFILILVLLPPPAQSPDAKTGAGSQNMLRKDAIALSINNQRKLKIRHKGKERIVYPYFEKNNYYLYAYCTMRNAPRTFTIGDILKWHVLDETFQKEPDIEKYLWDQRARYKKQSFNEYSKTNNNLKAKVIRPFTPVDAQKALDDKKVLFIKYVDSKGELSEREIDIYEINGLYFRARCHQVKRMRNFRCDRVIDWKSTEKSYTIKQRKKP